MRVVQKGQEEFERTAGEWLDGPENAQCAMRNPDLYHKDAFACDDTMGLSPHVSAHGTAFSPLHIVISSTHPPTVQPPHPPVQSFISRPCLCPSHPLSPFFHPSFTIGRSSAISHRPPSPTQVPVHLDGVHHALPRFQRVPGPRPHRAVRRGGHRGRGSQPAPYFPPGPPRTPERLWSLDPEVATSSSRIEVAAEPPIEVCKPTCDWSGFQSSRISIISGSSETHPRMSPKEGGGWWEVLEPTGHKCWTHDFLKRPCTRPR